MLFLGCATLQSRSCYSRKQSRLQSPPNGKIHSIKHVVACNSPIRHIRSKSSRIVTTKRTDSEGVTHHLTMALISRSCSCSCPGTICIACSRPPYQEEWTATLLCSHRIQGDKFEYTAKLDPDDDGTNSQATKDQHRKYEDRVGGKNIEPPWYVWLVRPSGK